MSVLILPNDRKVLESLIDAACKYYEISREDLLHSSSRVIANIRYQIFYLVKINTNLSTNVISDYLKWSRGVVRYGIEQIDAQKNVYTDTARDLKEIVFTANIATQQLLTLEWN